MKEWASVVSMFCVHGEQIHLQQNFSGDSARQRAQKAIISQVEQRLQQEKSKLEWRTKVILICSSLICTC